MSTNRKWKDALLKSGLPLEYEVKTFLQKEKKCLLRYEPSYLKCDDNGFEKEFSYDLNASYIRMPYDVELMIECKFRAEGTKWFFLPEEYGGMDEIYQNAFMHAIDHFHQWTWVWNDFMPYDNDVPPLCSKGMEVYENGEWNNKSIHQAVTQLSYGFAENIAETVRDHIDEEYGIHFRTLLLPIIVTTAELFRFKEGLGIDDIKAASAPEAVATNHDTLLIKAGADISLFNHNMFVFMTAFGEQKDLLAAKVQSFTKDIEHLFHVISKYRCPQALLVIRHSQDHTAFKRLFERVDRLLFPSDELLRRRDAFMQDLTRKITPSQKQRHNAHGAEDDSK